MTIRILPSSSRRRSAALAAAAGAAAALSLGVSQASAATTLSVDPVNGNNGNPGSTSQPVQTIGRALDLAAKGDTVRLAGGVYSSDTNHEVYTDAFGGSRLVVPAGVTIQGEANPNLPRTFLAGSSNQIGLSLSGDAKINDLFIASFGTGLQASRGKQTLRGVDFSRDGIVVAGTAAMTYTTSNPDPLAAGERGGVFTSLTGPAVRVSGAANFAMDGGVVQGGPPNCDTFTRGIEASAGAQITVRKDARFLNVAGHAILLTGGASASVQTSQIVAKYPRGCAPGAGIRVFDRAGLTLFDTTLTSNREGGGVGLLVGTTGNVTVNQSTIRGWNSSGIKTEAATKRLQINGSRIEDTSFGVNAIASPSAAVTITGGKVLNTLTGIEAGALKLRTTSVTSNLGTGVVLDGPLANLGQIGDPGGNTFQFNGSLGSVRFLSTVTSGGILAVGNTWQPHEQGADAQGHYAGAPIVPGSSPFAVGRNFRLPASDMFSIQL